MISACASIFFCLQAITASMMAVHLHLENLGIRDGQAAAAMAEHRIHLVQLIDALLDLGRRDAELLGRLRLASWPRAAGIRAAADRAGESSPAGRPSP